MAINDRKIEKLKERSAQLERRIKEDTAEKKRIDTQIKVLSYENLRAELSSHAMTADDYVQYAKLLKKWQITAYPLQILMQCWINLLNPTFKLKIRRISMKKTRFFSVLTSAAALAFACTGISASAAETTVSVPDDTSIVTEEINLEDMNLSDLVSMLGSASENSAAETTVSDENATSDDFTSDFYDTSGNATLIQSEKILYDSEEMQFISVTTKDGHVFYVLINYSAESGEDNVYFLNKVDDYDLYALLYAGDEENSDSSITPEDARQAAEQANGRVSNNPEKAESAETTASETAESNTASPVRSSGNMMPLLLAVGVVTVAAAGFLGFKFLKKKPKKSADTDSSDEEIEWYDDNEINEDEE